MQGTAVGISYNPRQQTVQRLRRQLYRSVKRMRIGSTFLLAASKSTDFRLGSL